MRHQELEDAADGAERRKGRSHAERRQGARGIERRVAWLWEPLVHWAGAPAKFTGLRDTGFLRVEQVLQERLSKLPAGLYAAKLRYGGGEGAINPSAAEVVRVTERLVAETLEALAAARRYPRELPRRVGDLEEWCGKAEARLRAAASALRRETAPEKGVRRVGECRPELPELASRGRMRRLLNSEATATAVSEYLWAGSGAGAPEFVAALPRLVEHPAWDERMAGLAGRICAFGEPAALAGHLLAWLETCRTVPLPPECDGRARSRLQGGLAALERWLASSGWAAANVVRLMETVGSHGAQMLSWILRRGGEAPNDFWKAAADGLTAVARLGELDAEGCRRIVELHLWSTADHILRWRPKWLPQLVRLDEGWLAVRQHHAWRTLFTMQDEKLLSRLLRWFDDAAARGARRQDVLAFADHWEVLVGSAAYERFLARHFWALDVLWQGLRRRPGAAANESGTLAGDAFGYRLCRFPFGVFLDLLMAAEEHGWRELPRLAEILVGLPSQFDEDPRCHRLCLELAGGDPARFEKLFASKKTRPLWDHASEALAGWRFLERSAAARQWLSSCAEQEDLRPRVLRLLERIALAVQIQLREELHQILAGWERPAPASGLVLPAGLPEDLRGTLSELAACRELAGEPEAIPESLRKILERPEAMRRELAALEKKRAEGTLPRQAAGRLRNLRTYLSDRERLEEWVIEDARSACPAEALRVHLRALERLLDEAIRSRWQVVLGPRRIPPGDSGWDNALRLHCHAEANRRFLKVLLRQVLEEGRGWPLDHPANAAFEEAMRRGGIDVEAWEGPLRQEFTVHGEQWEAYAENDPLRIFEMGNLFGTCLSVGRYNDYSTIANAVEANKRVLYLRNRRGAIVGRKLIGLVREPPQAGSGALLVGFRSYGSGEPLEEPGRPASRASAWVKPLFDVFCHEIAVRTGARLAGPTDPTEELAASLHLFARWYNDGPEPFDEWVIEAGAGGSLVWVGGARRVVAALVRRQDPEQRAALARGLLWLGAIALPVLEHLDLAALGPEALAFLRRHTASVEVRRWIVERM